MNDDIVAKLNDAAAQLRQATQSLGTDYLSRQSVPGAGHIPVGSGARALDLLPPDQADGSVLTLDSQHPLGVKWGVGGEVDSDAAGNVWEGPAALASVGAGTGNTAVGNSALQDQTNNESTAIGYLAQSFNSYDDMVVVGARAQSITGAVAVGWHAQSTGVNSVGVGRQSLAAGSAAVAVGYQAQTNGDGCVAVGNGAFAQTNSVAVGPGAYAFTSSVAIGPGALSAGHFGNSNTAVGAGALNHTSVGVGHTAVGCNAGSVVNDSIIVINYTTALGYNAQATGPGCVAIGVDQFGNGAASSTVDTIVLGTANHTTNIPGLPAFVSGDKYLVVDSSGNIHKSALGPAS